MKGRSKLAIALAGALAALALASLGWAAIPNAGGVIHGCYDKNSGQLRVTDTDTSSPKACTAKEAALTWSQQGPQGLQGPQGSQGTPGPAGPAGLSGVHMVTGQLGPWNTSGIHQLSVHCPGTEDVLGVGYQLDTEDQYGYVLGAPAARVESVEQVNKVGGWGPSTHGWGTISVSVDATKLAAGKSVGGTLSVTCATVAA